MPWPPTSLDFDVNAVKQPTPDGPVALVRIEPNVLVTVPIDERKKAPERDHTPFAAKVLLNLMFGAAFVCAFVAAIEQIDVAKKAAEQGHPQSKNVVLFLLLTKILKAPKTYWEAWVNRKDRDKLYFNGILSIGVTIAIAIWAVAYHYTLQ